MTYIVKAGTRQWCCMMANAADLQHSISRRTVDVPGVSDVVLQVLQGRLASHDGLDEEAEHGEHGQTAVLDLLHLQAKETLSKLCSSTATSKSATPTGVTTQRRGWAAA